MMKYFYSIIHPFYQFNDNFSGNLIAKELHFYFEFDWKSS